jgi:hypothetical protein
VRVVGASVLSCTPERTQDGVVVDLSEPRATSSVDKSQEFGCIEFLRLTLPNDLPPDMYEFRLAANSREWRCTFMLPYQEHRIHKECFYREFPGAKKCPDYCAEYCTKGFPDGALPVCSGDLQVDLMSRDTLPTIFLTEVPDSLELTVLRDGEVARRETIRPEYRMFAPNESAPPVCRQAGVDLGAKKP